MPRPLTEEDVADFRDRLIAVAEVLFAEQGPNAVTLRQLATALGVSPMTPYRYFRDKDHILSAVRAHGFNRFAETLEAAYESGGDPLSRSAAVADAYVDFATTHPAAYRLMFDLSQPGDDDDRELLAASHRARASLYRHADGLIGAGLITGEPKMVGHMMWACLHGALVLQMAGKLSPDIDPVTLRRECFLALARGMGLKRAS